MKVEELSQELPMGKVFRDEYVEFRFTRQEAAGELSVSQLKGRKPTDKSLDFSDKFSTDADTLFEVHQKLRSPGERIKISADEKYMQVTEDMQVLDYTLVYTSMNRRKVNKKTYVVIEYFG